MGTDKRGGVQAESDREGGDISGQESYEGKLFRVQGFGGPLQHSGTIWSENMV